jgi:alkyldihydroxyacetonephosphate synthase
MAQDMSAEIVRALTAIVGDDGMVHDAAEIEAHAYDARGPRDAADAPDPIAVVCPRSADEVAAIVRIANEQRTPLVPYGGGTGLMGGARSAVPAIVIDTRRLNAIREVDASSGFAWAEAGVVLRDLDGALAAHGLMAAHDPWTFGIATVGGTISTNGLGFLGGKYGSMGEQVLAIEAVLPDGRIVRTRPVRPHSTGPNLARLLIAGEGTFGIITAAAVRAFARPESRELRGYRFPTFAAGFGALLEMQRIGLAPTVLDYGDHPADGDEATLYAGFDGFREEVAACLERSRAISVAAGGSDVDDDEVREFWETRHAIADRYARTRSLRRRGRRDDGQAFDYVHVSLPASRVLECRTRALAIAAERGVHVFETGLWVTPGLLSITMTAGDAPRAGAAMDACVDELLRAAQDAGGSMEYCHGAGLRLAHLMERELGAGLDVLRDLKRALDPNGIMNPGKLALS